MAHTISAAIAVAKMLAEHQAGYDDAAEAIRDYAGVFRDDEQAEKLYHLVEDYIESGRP